MNDETLPESEPAPESSRDEISQTHALVLAWSRDEPWRIGQSLLVPPGGPGPTITFGRGPADAADTTKGSLREHRFFQSIPTPPFASGSISRTQLELHATEGGIFVRNVGRCALFRNGISTTEAEFLFGDTLQLGKQALFYVAKCPTTMVRSSADYPDFPFGEADPHGIVGESPAAWRLRGHIAANGLG